MQQLAYIVSGTADAQRKAEQAKEKLDRIPRIASMLITIVVPCEMPMDKARCMRDAVREIFPEARVLVHTCAIKMADLRLNTEGIMLTFTALEESRAEFVVIDGNRSDAALKTNFVNFVSARPHTKLIEFLVAGVMDQIDDLFEGFSAIDDRIQVFGAFVDAPPMNAHGYIIADDEETSLGMAAIVFHGETLEVHIVRNFGWNSLGREIVATRVEGCTIKELDGDIPLRVYERYFGIKGDGDFSSDAALFPLCFEEEDGSVSARVPIKIEAGSGELTFGIPMQEGTVFRLAYGDPYGILSKAAENTREMSEFSPQAIFGTACVGHYLLLGEDVVTEMSVCAGFPSSTSFVYGEVRRVGRRISTAHLNVLLVGMKEDSGCVQDTNLQTKRVAHLSYNRKMLAFMSHFIRVSEEELHTANQRLTHLASRDTLTNLLNRREMERLLKDAVKLSQEQKTPLSVILMDIDHFKGVNDTYGHDMGDKVLLKVADAISHTIRGSDAGCRWGGDEFFIILQGASLLFAGKVGERIRRTVEASEMPFDRNITVSVGVASFDAEKDSDLQLFKNADEALYQAKKAGRNAVYALGLGRVGSIE
jgi:sensory box/GGDEF domain protein